jgi:hypothetical protein
MLDAGNALHFNQCAQICALTNSEWEHLRAGRSVGVAVGLSVGRSDEFCAGRDCEVSVEAALFRDDDDDDDDDDGDADWFPGAAMPDADAAAAAHGDGAAYAGYGSLVTAACPVC